MLNVMFVERADVHGTLLNLLSYWLSNVRNVCLNYSKHSGSRTTYKADRFMTINKKLRTSFYATLPSFPFRDHAMGLARSNRYASKGELLITHKLESAGEAETLGKQYVSSTAEAEYGRPV